MLRCRLRFLDAQLRRAARSHIAGSEIEHATAIAGLRHPNDGAAASLLDVIGMGRNGKKIERRKIFKYVVLTWAEEWDQE